MSAKILACTMCIVPRINCMFTWAQPHALWAWGRTQYISTKNYLKDHVVALFIILLVGGPICLTKIYFIFQPLQNDTVCLHCTVTATKRVDILHYGNKESNIVWCASVRAGVVPLFDQILAGAALGAVPVPTRAGNKPWRKLKFYNHGEGRSRG